MTEVLHHLKCGAIPFNDDFIQSHMLYQDIYRLLLNQTVRHTLQYGPTLNPAFSQKSLTHTVLPYFFNIWFNVIIPSILRSTV